MKSKEALWYVPARDTVWPRAGFPWLSISLLAAAVAVVFLCELSLGPMSIPFQDVLSALVSGRAGQAFQTTIIFTIRLPRALTAMAAGAALATSGLLLQTLFRNPLAGPWVLGITSGARLGVGVVTLLGTAAVTGLFADYAAIADLGLAGGAFLGSCIAVVLVARMARTLRPVALLILGLMIQYLAEALYGFAYQFTHYDQLVVAGGWLDGSFRTASREQLWILLPAVGFGLILAGLLAKPLNALLIGEVYASSLGLRLRQVRRLVLTSMIALSGSVTAFCGPLVFLDIAVPHLCRGLLNTSDHRALLPASALMGALIALIGDMVIHLPMQRHIFHLNYVTALVGVPVVLWVILRRKGMDPAGPES